LKLEPIASTGKAWKILVRGLLAHLVAVVVVLKKEAKKKPNPSSRRLD
jgi:hypothetical protein